MVYTLRPGDNIHGLPPSMHPAGLSQDKPSRRQGTTTQTVRRARRGGSDSFADGGGDASPNSCSGMSVFVEDVWQAASDAGRQTSKREPKHHLHDYDYLRTSFNVFTVVSSMAFLSSAIFTATSDSALYTFV